MKLLFFVNSKLILQKEFCFNNGFIFSKTSEKHITSSSSVSSDILKKAYLFPFLDCLSLIWLMTTKELKFFFLSSKSLFSFLIISSLIKPLLEKKFS